MPERSTEWFIDLADWHSLVRVGVHLVVAMLLGAIAGIERERERKFAGIRTHMLVALGACLIVAAPLEAGLKSADMSRVVQGLVTGVGFLGGGTILKLSSEHEVRGLTTAASLWVTAGVGMSVGLGLIWPALLAAGFTWIVLRWLPRSPGHS